MLITIILLLTIITLFLIIFFISFAKYASRQILTLRRFLEIISDQLVPIANGKDPVKKASTLRNDIKLLLIYEKYASPESRADFKRRRPRFIKKYNLQ